jgi:hypothetical protein
MFRSTLDRRVNCALESLPSIGENLKIIFSFANIFRFPRHGAEFSCAKTGKRLAETMVTVRGTHLQDDGEAGRRLYHGLARPPCHSSKPGGAPKALRFRSVAGLKVAPLCDAPVSQPDRERDL